MAAKSLKVRSVPQLKPFSVFSFQRIPRRSTLNPDPSQAVHVV